MMNIDAIQLTKRYHSSFMEYFKNVPDDWLLTMMMNLLLETYGFNNIVAILGDEGTKFVQRGKLILKKSMRKMWRTKFSVDAWVPTSPTRGDEEDCFFAEQTPREQLRVSRLKNNSVVL